MAKRIKIDDLARELAETFINGNIADAVQGVIKQPNKKKALLLSELIQENLSAWDQASLVSFKNILRRHLDTY